jgi:drug/metabolite transporter (DMT)-like permease
MKFIFFFIAILSLSQAASLSKLAAAQPEMICFWRLAAGSTVMLLLALKNGNFHTKLSDFKNRSSFFALLSGIFFYAHLWSFQYAAQKTSIANVMILFSSNPLFTALITFFLLKEVFEKKLIPAYFFGIIAIAILVAENIQLNSVNTIGDFAALISALLYSGYIVCGHLARKTMANTTFTYFIYAVAGLLFYLTSIIRDTKLIGYSDTTWMAIAGLIIFPTLLGHALFTYLLRFINVNWLSTGKLAEPIFASISAFFLFSEKWNQHTALAFSMTVISLLILLEPWKYFGQMRKT